MGFKEIPLFCVSKLWCKLSLISKLILLDLMVGAAEKMHVGNIIIGTILRGLILHSAQGGIQFGLNNPNLF